MTAPDAPLDRFRISRRAAIRTGVYGAGAIALGGLAVAPALYKSARRGAVLQAARLGAVQTPFGSYDFNQGWLFGGPYTAGAERPGCDDRHFAGVTVPHTVVPLSWTDWSDQAWQQRWIYRKPSTARTWSRAAIGCSSPSTG